MTVNRSGLAATVTINPSVAIAGTLSVNGTFSSGNATVSGSVTAGGLVGTDNIQVNPATGGYGVYLNWANAGSGVIFGNGAGGQVGGITKAGVFTATTKNFQITHPLDDTKYLTHSSLEGPECGVFYRGEGETDASGTATITLPDYFEALVMPTGRTVQITALYEDDDESEIGKVAAGRVKDGAFRVRSEYASQKFYWEVKAIRSDIAPLEVVTDKPVEAEQQPLKSAAEE
jgi:hypothetical protein